MSTWNVDDLFDDPDFVGLAYEVYRQWSNERVPIEAPRLVHKSVGRVMVENLLALDTNLTSVSIYPVFRRTKDTP